MSILTSIILLFDTVRNCQKDFAFELRSIILARHSEHFLIKYKACDNAFCKSV